jgi:hypothetical protein
MDAHTWVLNELEMPTFSQGKGLSKNGQKSTFFESYWTHSKTPGNGQKHLFRAISVSQNAFEHCQQRTLEA